jgi:predicted metal-dependent peptidase
MVGVIPGRRRRAARPRVVSIIDTSSSMTEALLEEVDAELARLARHFEVVVVEADAEVQRTYRYRKLEPHRGRGGTDLRPALAAEFLRRHHPDVIIYFTDGYGPAPAVPPRPPVLWCLTEGGRPPAPWGRVIRMAPDDCRRPRAP